MRVELKANAGATRRTKNRIREHGPRFTVERKALITGEDKVIPSWLLRGGDWLGWLPVNEFELIKNSS